MNYKKYLSITAFSLFLIIFSSGFCQASSVYLDPEKEEYYKGEVFIVEILVDTETECINTVDIGLSFDPSVLKVEDFSKGESLLSVWLKEPEFFNEEGRLLFSGGIPGGYCGRLPGDPGKSNILGKVIFSVKSHIPGETQVVFSNDSRVLLNDGKGSDSKLHTIGSTFTVLSGRSNNPRHEWQNKIEEDKTSPEPFEIKISREESVFDGKYFISFSTIDKQTGVDHYEIKEGGECWKVVSSPYILENQKLDKIIKVKAVDKASNERIVEFVPDNNSILNYLFLIFSVLIIIITVQFFYRKRKP